MVNLDQPNETIVPSPPPPPAQDVVQQARYVPPVVVDTIKPKEAQQLITADEAQVEVRNVEVVEEMPMFPGGDAALLAYIAAHTNYPEVAKENNIQGRVFIRFFVTSKGCVDKVSLYKGVDPELDAEAIRVVKTLPLFTLGKQGGKSAPVWYSIPINFQLK